MKRSQCDKWIPVMNLLPRDSRQSGSESHTVLLSFFLCFFFSSQIIWIWKRRQKRETGRLVERSRAGARLNEGLSTPFGERPSSASFYSWRTAGFLHSVKTHTDRHTVTKPAVVSRQVPSQLCRSKLRALTENPPPPKKNHTCCL